MTDNNTDDDPICNKCGRARSEHGLDERTLEPTKCPAPREEKTTPPQETARKPRGDY
jgi:hypothetical protein